MEVARVDEHPRVVLVEDDELLQAQLAAALERALPEIALQQTPDADEALALLREGGCELLITEAQSAAVDGLALAACARQHCPTLPVIFLGADEASDARARIAAFGGSHLVDKPPELERFVGLVARVLEAPPGVQRRRVSRDLVELVQRVARTTPTGALHVCAPEGRGTMWLERGAIVHAVGGGERGALAVQRMLRWSGGGFHVEVDAVAPERTISAPDLYVGRSARRPPEARAGSKSPLANGAGRRAAPLHSGAFRKGTRASEGTRDLDERSRF